MVEVSEVADREEILRLLTEAARGGSVSAMRALLETTDRPEEDGSDGFAELDNVTPIRKAG